MRPQYELLLALSTKDGVVTRPTTTRTTRRRQARGFRRIEHLLDVAAQIFAEVGFEAATTNAIAARAGVSPGSLYQFFPNKDAIAEALIDHVIDPLVAFHVNHPGFQAMFSGSIVSPRLAAATQTFLEAVIARAE